MKRSWIGFSLLLLLLALCIWVTVKMTRIHEPIESDLLLAADLAIEENWTQAGHFFREAENQWTNQEHFRACFADHNPVEEIDAAFAMLEIYCAAQEKLAFAGGCRDLARKVAAVGEAHAFVWWNFL